MLECNRMDCETRFMLVFLCLVFSVLSTIPSYEDAMSHRLFFMEVAMVAWFTMEYVLRLWSSGCRSRYQGVAGRGRFAQRPSCILDAVIIISSLIVLAIGSSGQVFATSALRGLRFFQILRMMRMDRRGGTWKLLGSVVWAHRQELLTTLYIGFLGLIFASFLVFLLEKGHNDNFGTYADALWWGVITLCTVGYGDVFPITWGGKIVASFCALMGISFFALPAGILGSGFALKVQQQQRQKHLIRRRVPAANLIQSLWRCYAADQHSMSIATWKPHMIPVPSPSVEVTKLKSNSSFVSRFSTRRKDRSHTANNHNNNTSSASPSPNVSTRQPAPKARTASQAQPATDNEEIPDALNRLINQTWSPLSIAMGDKDSTQAFPIRKENSVSSFYERTSEVSEDQEAPSPGIAGVEQLTEVHRNAIRAVRKIRYFMMRRKFREALRPYDVKDVMEQYSAGHVDMLSRTKSLQCRLDQILGKLGSKAKDVYDSKISLASRIVKTERQVDDIEGKLDLLMEMYKEDRRVVIQQQQQMQDMMMQFSENNKETGELSSSQAQTNSAPKPKPILIDSSRHVTTERGDPTTPILRNPLKPMRRNLSDLGPRIKKRVTYLSLSDVQQRAARRDLIPITPRTGTIREYQPLNENDENLERCRTIESGSGADKRFPRISLSSLPEKHYSESDLSLRGTGSGSGYFGSLERRPLGGKYMDSLRRKKRLRPARLPSSSIKDVSTPSETDISDSSVFGDMDSPSPAFKVTLADDQTRGSPSSETANQNSSTTFPQARLTFSYDVGENICSSIDTLDMGEIDEENERDSLLPKTSAEYKESSMDYLLPLDPKVTHIDDT